MPETMALIRLSLLQSRWLLFWMVAALAFGLTTATYVGSVEPQSGGSFAVMALLLSLMPASFAVVLLFEYGHESDISLPMSGCSPWLLRMPIRSWKIAIVPIVLKTLWLSSLWILFVAVTRRFGANQETSLLVPCIGFSAAAIWVLVIAWRPFRSGWTRLAAFVLAAPLLYASIAFLLQAPHINQVEWRPFAVQASALFAIAIYVCGVVAAVQSVELARICGQGIIPGAGRKTSLIAPSKDDHRERRFQTVHQALLYHDHLRHAIWVRGVMLFVVLPTMIGFAALVPFSGRAVGIALFLFAYFGFIAISRSSVFTEGSLTPYLNASPLSNATIAWTRFLMPIGVAGGVYCCVFFVFAAWACRAEYREIWLAWAGDRAAAVGQGAEPLMIGLRWSITIVLVWAVAFLGRLATCAWIAMAGRPWVTILMTVVGSLTVIIPAGVALRWFMQQTDWESARVSALSYWTLVPYVVAGLLLLKTIFAAIVSFSVVRAHACSSGDVVRVIAIWAALTGSVAVAFSLLIPDPRVTLVWCIAATALAIPLGRIVVLPLAVAWNRHR